MPTLYKFSVRREYLNSGGYNDRGRYFGVGAPLFYYQGEVLISPPDREPYTDLHEGWMRAADREKVKTWVRAMYPQAKFYR